MSRWYDDGFFKPSRPRAARGGIKAHTQRGALVRSWWGQRWTAVLEGFQLGARLTRGRSYARRGQVLDIVIDKGCVRARVQGSRPAPYAVTIKMKALSGAQWAKVATALAREARFAAQLLASEMPQDIETTFKALSLSLFPTRHNDLHTECSCPDWSNPCKHIAAVYYLLAEEFDRDPFLIFKLRGMARDELLRALRDQAHQPGAKRRARSVEATPHPALPAAEPLRAQADVFWSGSALPENLFAEAQAPASAAALTKRLGPFPFWRGAVPLLEALEPVYAQAAPHGVAVFLGMHDADKEQNLMADVCGSVRGPKDLSTP